jgi:MFS family permease
MASPQEMSREYRKVVAASVFGTIIEWYDFIIYGTAAALVFNKLFFPSFDPLVGTLAALAAYGVGFLGRPLGAVIFGHHGARFATAVRPPVFSLQQFLQAPSRRSSPRLSSVTLAPRLEFPSA